MGLACRELGGKQFLNLNFLLCKMGLFYPLRMEMVNVNDLALRDGCWMLLCTKHPRFDVVLD